MADMKLKTVDSNMSDSLLNESGYLKIDGEKRRVDQERLESYSVVHIRNSNYKQIELDFLNKLFIEALKNEKKFIEKSSSSALQATTLQEQWLAPRLHYGLRITRSEASNPELWNYLALKFDTYVARRWTYDKDGINTTQIETKGIKVPQIPRENHFIFKMHSRHQIAKLWWMAEMTRNKGKYHKDAGIINTDMVNYCLDITAPNFHPYIISILKMEEDILGDGSYKLNTPWLKALFRIINRKIIHEGGISKAEFKIDHQEARKWFNGTPDAKYTKFSSDLPPAPNDIEIDDKMLDQIINWLRNGIESINNSEYKHLRDCSYQILKKVKKPLSVPAIISHDDEGYFEQDWQKKELGFALEIGGDKRFNKTGSSWEIS